MEGQKRGWGGSQTEIKYTIQTSPPPSPVDAPQFLLLTDNLKSYIIITVTAQEKGNGDYI